MGAADYWNLTPEIASGAQNIDRWQPIIQALAKRGMTGAKGQMAGRFYVPPSPWQGVEQLANAGLAAYGMYQSGKETEALGKQYKKGQTEAMDKLTAALLGQSPASTYGEAEKLGRHHCYAGEELRSPLS